MIILFFLATFIQISHLCPFGCLLCNNNGSCSSCPSQSFRNDDPANNCTCMLGFYEKSTSKICQPCPFQCSKCQFDQVESKVICLECNQNEFRQIQSKKCICFQGYYEIPNQPICSKCSPHCKTCFEFSKCTSCDTSRYRVREPTIQNTCPCLKGYYNAETSECKQCDQKCKTCVKQKMYNMVKYKFSRCIQCADTQLFFNQTTQECECYQNSYFNAQGRCIRCLPVCQYCVNSSSNCINCISNLRVLEESCKCQSHYYQTSTLDCKSCHKLCRECTGPEQFSCLTCDLLNGKVFNELLHTCVCNTSSYMHKFECLPCYNHCTSCTDSKSTSCNTCFDQFTHQTIDEENSCQLVCNNQYWPFKLGSQANCRKCHPYCLQCFDSECLYCIKNRFTMQNRLYLCQEECLNDTYYTSNKTIQSCKSINFCKECDCFGCIKCIQNYFLTQNQKACLRSTEILGECYSQICDDCCAQDLFSFDDLCYEACPPGTQKKISEYNCITDEKVSQISYESSLAINQDLHNQFNTHLSDQGVLLVASTILFIGIINPIFFPLFENMNLIVYIFLTKTPITFKTESIMKIVFYYSAFSPKIIPFTWFDYKPSPCGLMTNCMEQLTSLKKGAYDSFQVQVSAGPQFSLLFILLIIKFIVVVMLILSRRSKYREHHRLILVNIYNNYKQRSRHGLRIFILEKISSNLTAFMSHILLPPIIIASILNFRCLSFFDKNFNTFILSLLGLVISFIVYTHDFIRLGNIMQKHFEQLNFDHKKNIENMPEHLKQQYILSIKENIENQQLIFKYLLYIRSVQKQRKLQFISFFILGILIFAFEEIGLISMILYFFYAMLNQVLNYSLKKLNIVEKIYFTVGFFQNLLLLLSGILILVNSKNLDETVLYMIVTIICFSFVQILLKLTNFILQYKVYLVIQSTDMHEVVVNPENKQLQKNVRRKLRQENDDEENEIQEKIKQKAIDDELIIINEDNIDKIENLDLKDKIEILSKLDPIKYEKKTKGIQNQDIEKSGDNKKKSSLKVDEMKTQHLSQQQEIQSKQLKQQQLPQQTIQQQQLELHKQQHSLVDQTSQESPKKLAVQFKIAKHKQQERLMKKEFDQNYDSWASADS